MIVFATPNFLSILSESLDWYCDGTFKVVPDLFFQLYTTMLKRREWSYLVSMLYS